LFLSACNADDIYSLLPAYKKGYIEALLPAYNVGYIYMPISFPTIDLDPLFLPVLQAPHVCNIGYIDATLAAYIIENIDALFPA
jgi:hypothetical protein